MANYQNKLKLKSEKSEFSCGHNPPFFCWCGCELHKAFNKDKTFFMWVCSDCADEYEPPFLDDWDNDLVE